CQQFWRVRASLGQLLEARNRRFELIEHPPGPQGAVGGDHVVNDVREVRRGVLGEQHRVLHSPDAVRSRSALKTSRAGTVRPCSTCWLPSARTLSSAKVCCVCSNETTSCSTARASPFCVMTSGSRSRPSCSRTSAAFAFR